MEEISIKLLLVGDSGVGKTSLLLQYTDNSYPLDHVATIGVEYKIKMFKYKNFNVKLQIWDTAGQERFHSITNNFFHNADGILFVYDITNRKSFLGAKNWIKEAKEVGNYFQTILIGNKIDLEEYRKVLKVDAEDYCKENNIELFEASAKDNLNLKEAFSKMVELIFKDKTDEEIIREYGETNNSLSVISKNSKQKIKKKKHRNKNEKERCC